MELERIKRLRTYARCMGAHRTDWEQAVNEAADEIERLSEIIDNMRRLLGPEVEPDADPSWPDPSYHVIASEHGPQRVAKVGPCPQCGEAKNIRVNWVDVGTEAGLFDMVPGSFECMNPECPTNRDRQQPPPGGANHG